MKRFGYELMDICAEYFFLFLLQILYIVDNPSKGEDVDRDDQSVRKLEVCQSISS